MYTYYFCHILIIYIAIYLHFISLLYICVFYMPIDYLITYIFKNMYKCFAYLIPLTYFWGVVIMPQ